MLHMRDAELADIPLIRELTFNIWPATYGSILSKGQIDYMLDMMYRPEVLERQISREQSFFICYDDDTAVGFAAIGPKPADLWHLHKIYILPEQQGKGIGKFMLNHLVQYLKPKAAKALQLNVNRYNNAKRFYEKTGFKVLREEDIDIGSGYFMNDYIMQLDL